MERSTNALAELAEQLEAVYAVANRGCTEETRVGKVVRKAQRIVAELANVTADYKCDPWQEFSIQAKYAVLRSRAIAEEGAGDGK